jgi:segregation and condensation protein B
MAGADLKKKVESILFAAGRAILLKELQSLLHINEPGLIKETIRELKEDYESKDSPLMILSEDEGWKLTVREGFLPLVRKINPHTELSKTIIETLAVIAWKQPALQSDVVKIRTNKAYDHIAELNRLGFIIKERHGRSFLVRVTQKFLDYFDLPDDKSIKEAFKDFKDIEIAVQKRREK